MKFIEVKQIVAPQGRRRTTKDTKLGFAWVLVIIINDDLSVVITKQ
jgi:hypothetical protein